MVKIGQASIDENGKTHGGQSGNQSGKELNIRQYYSSSKGWRVFRANKLQCRPLIAKAMQLAVSNLNIGYDQYQRDTLWNYSRQYGFDPSRVTVKCETDCSALVRVCCAYAGIILQNFNTSMEPQVLLNSGEFSEVFNFNPFNGNGLIVGDILVTKTKGHTLVVIDSDTKTSTITTYTIKGYTLRDVRKGEKSEYVRFIQQLLTSKGFSTSLDGVFGSKTETSVKQFQKFRGLVQDGIVGINTWRSLLN